MSDKTWCRVALLCYLGIKGLAPLCRSVYVMSESLIRVKRVWECAKVRGDTGSEKIDRVFLDWIKGSVAGEGLTFHVRNGS
ncbi:hypothetical protein QR685DRAFT_97067 [Neurospora intermedia]|uniref:Secreted protein n=1 Tax=Neurospora intermedia TaxID=5142 RepID=A0ABR3D2B9_NEUIN